jgi:hypothetical protein
MYEETHVYHHVKCLLFLPYFNQNWNILTNSTDLTNIKFRANPFGGSRNFRANRPRRDMEKQMGAFLQLLFLTSGK